MVDYAEIVSNIKTCKDWLDVFNRPDVDAVDLGYYLSEYDYDETPYDYLGNIEVDSIDYSNAEFLGNSSVLPSEHNRVSKYNYFKGYDKRAPTKEAEKIIKDRLGFTWYHSTFNIQPPNNVTRLHFDIITSFLDSQDNLADIPFDIKRLQPVGDKPIRRVFVALSDWQDGWIFQIGKDQWSGWKKGDVINFNWRHAPHSTANASWSTRSLLKITGYSPTIDDVLSRGIPI